MTDKYIAAIHIAEHESHYSVCKLPSLPHEEVSPIQFTKVFAQRIYADRGENKTFKHGSMQNLLVLKAQARLLKPRSLPEWGISEILQRVLEITDGVDNLFAVAIGCFGPFVSLKPREPGYGCLQDISSHRLWRNADIKGIADAYFEKARTSESENLPQVHITTDVDMVSLGEFWLRNMDEHSDQIEFSTGAFLKISRAVNGGVTYQGEIWSGAHHPLMSVIKPRRFSFIQADTGKKIVDKFEGICSVHGSCIEGLIGTEAITARLGPGWSLENVGKKHLIWELIPYYAAELCVNVAANFSPQFIVLGGRSIELPGIKKNKPDLISRVRYYFERAINGNNRTSPSYPELQDLNTFIKGRSEAFSGTFGGLVHVGSKLWGTQVGKAITKRTIRKISHREVF